MKSADNHESGCGDVTAWQQGASARRQADVVAPGNA